MSTTSVARGPSSRPRMRRTFGSPAQCDAGSVAQVTDLFARIGPVDVMVHAAGFTRDRLLLPMSDRDVDDVLAVHLAGGFRASRHALPPMLARRWGRIVYLVSPTAGAGRRGQSHYGAATADLIGLFRALGREAGPLGVTVNCVSAGFMATELTASVSADVRAALIAAIRGGRAGRNPLLRPGELRHR